MLREKLSQAVKGATLMRQVDTLRIMLKQNEEILKAFQRDFDYSDEEIKQLSVIPRSTDVSGNVIPTLLVDEVLLTFDEDGCWGIVKQCPHCKLWYVVGTARPDPDMLTKLGQYMESNKFHDNCPASLDYQPRPPKVPFEEQLLQVLRSIDASLERMIPY